MTSPSNKDVTSEGLRQRSPEWFAAHKGRVTASVAGAVLGVSPFMKAKAVTRAMVRAYHDAPSEFTGNCATRYGTEMEPYAIADYAKEKEEVVAETGFHGKDDWLGGSPDGLVDSNGMIEVKCPYGKRHLLDTEGFKSLSELPHYYAQIQVCLYCTDRTWCDFIQWCPLGGMKIERVYVDKVWLQINIPLLKRFYDEYLEERGNKEHIEEKYLATTGLETLADEYADLTNSIKSANERKKEIIVHLREATEDRAASIGIHKLIKSERKGTVNYKKVVENLLPDVELQPFTGKAAVVWSIR